MTPDDRELMERDDDAGDRELYRQREREINGPPRVYRIGWFVRPWGKITAVGVVGGERYYWLEDRRGSVSMIPADVVERKRPRHPCGCYADEPMPERCPHVEEP